MQSQNAYPMLGQSWSKLVIPAVVLLIDKLVGITRDDIALFQQCQIVGACLRISVFNLLNQTGHANFKELIQVAGCNGEKFQPFKEWIACVLRLFQYAPIEGQPRGFAIEVVRGIVKLNSNHDQEPDSLAGFLRCLVFGLLVRILSSGPVLNDYCSVLGSSRTLQNHVSLLNLDAYRLSCRPLVRQRIFRMPWLILSHIDCLLELHRNVVVGVFTCDRRVYDIVQNARARFPFQLKDLSRLKSRLGCERELQRKQKCQYSYTHNSRHCNSEYRTALEENS